MEQNHNADTRHRMLIQVDNNRKDKVFFKGELLGDEFSAPLQRHISLSDRLCSKKGEVHE